MLTDNQKKVIRLLLAATNKDYSVNQIAEQCSLSPNGAYKILKSFEAEGILKRKEIANITSFRIDFSNDKTRPTLELALIDKLDKKISNRVNDIKGLKGLADACIIFGSYLTKKDPNDIDLFFLVEKENYKKFSIALDKAKEIIPVKVHDVVQTQEDLARNIDSPVIQSIIRQGTIAWGQADIVRVIKSVYKA